MHAIKIATMAFSDLMTYLDGTAVPPCLVEERRTHAASEPVVIESILLVGIDEFAHIIFVLPGLSARQLLELGACRPSCYNEDSADLLKRTSYMAWAAKDVEARVDCWRLREFLDGIADGQFVVVFTSGEHAVIARHTLDSDATSGFQADIQGCCIASGPNYRPSRQYSEQEIEVAHGQREVVRKGVLTADVWTKRG